MNFPENWCCQKNWTDNIAAVLTTFCRFYQLDISRAVIYDKYVSQIAGQMANFNVIESFCKDWNMEFITLPFVEKHLDNQFLPGFVLMEGYKTQLVVKVEKGVVYFVDGIRGWMEESIPDFFSRSMGHITLVDINGYNPDPNFEENTLADEQNVNLLKSTFDLRIIEDFMTEEECDRLVSFGGDNFVRSTVVSNDSATGAVESKVRTSSSCFLMMKDQFLDEIRERASDLIDKPKEYFENVQLTAYSKGQQYDVHTDSFIEEEALKEGQRTHTILVYLNDDYEGGATLFPRLNLNIKAKKGKAVVWRGLTDSGQIDDRGMHGGLPVRNGRKVICNLWVRDKKMSNWG